MIKIAIGGCCGKMGSRIAALALKDEDIRITGACEQSGNPNIGKSLGELLGIRGMEVKISSDAEEAIKNSDVLIEFTTPEATMAHLEIARKHKKAMVIGTTGIDAAGLEKIKSASKDMPIVFSPNMAVGVNLLFNLVKNAAEVLKDFKINIREAHHKHKKDAPSGTAKKIAEIAEQAGGSVSLPIESIREGEIIGDHTVIYDGEFETLELRHHAKSRDVFASGALFAAKYIAEKKKGLYNMQDIFRR